jgi:hypothetical protein
MRKPNESHHKQGFKKRHMVDTSNVRKLSSIL